MIVMLGFRVVCHFELVLCPSCNECLCSYKARNVGFWDLCWWVSLIWCVGSNSLVYFFIWVDFFDLELWLCGCFDWFSSIWCCVHHALILLHFCIFSFNLLFFDLDLWTFFDVVCF